MEIAAITVFLFTGAVAVRSLVVTDRLIHKAQQGRLEHVQRAAALKGGSHAPRA